MSVRACEGFQPGRLCISVTWTCGFVSVCVCSSATCVRAYMLMVRVCACLSILFMCMCVCVCVCVWAEEFISFQTVSQSSLWGGGSLCSAVLCCLIFFLLFFFIFYFPQSETTRWVFAAWLQPVMSLLPLAAAFAHAVLLCVIFFMCVSLYSNIPAYFHVYILLWIACKVGFVCVHVCILVCVQVFIVEEGTSVSSNVSF